MSECEKLKRFLLLSWFFFEQENTNAEGSGLVFEVADICRNLGLHAEDKYSG